MHREFLMGNEAMALGALAAGVGLCAGYPGTPSTEVLETAAKRNPGGVHVEWSVNEKAAMETAAGASYAGVRTLVTMKQVGLNVASDPLMSLAYIGVKGGMVVLVADDPGPISSQTEQDTRTFAMYSKLPVFDPSSVEEAYRMMGDAFALSEKLGTPVLMRPTTRIDHGYADVEVKDPEEYEKPRAEGFVKDSSRWVIFPRLSLANHAKIEARNRALRAELSRYGGNVLVPETGAYAQAFAGRRLGVASQGISWSYLTDALASDDHPRLLKVGTPFPFPDELAAEFLDGLDEVLVIEELDPVVERGLVALCGRRGLKVRIRGKEDGTVRSAGENTVKETAALIRDFAGAGVGNPASAADPDELPPLPVRPPVLCAGCPHRASFYAVKRAMKGKKTIFCGDIGCYTLGNAAPLHMVDTCLCMGAGITVAQGLDHAGEEGVCFAFVGDSTFFASGMTGVANAVYNRANLVVVVLDNSTTAMTGHQPHPGLGKTMMRTESVPISIEAVLKALGVGFVRTADPLDHEAAVRTVKEAAAETGVRAIVFRSPCIKYR